MEQAEITAGDFEKGWLREVADVEELRQSKLNTNKIRKKEAWLGADK